MASPAAALLALAAAASFAAGEAATAPKDSHEVLILRERPGELIRPLLDVDTAVPGAHWLGVKRSLEGLLRRRAEAGDLTSAAVYFRDLSDGSWFGIREDEDYFPASLLKVPCLIAAYKKAEDEPGFLASMVTFPADGSTRPQAVLPEATLEPGRPYPVSEVLRTMVVHSDNRAFSAAQRAIGPEPLRAVFTDLGLTIEKVEKASSLSVREMAVFFRVLYNATYLDRRSSRRALSLLTSTRYRDGLPAGVPKTVVVAHKFGEKLLAEGGEAQLHDCGIVYYPDLPYQLCVMTRGRDHAKLASVIADVSSRVYRSVDAQFQAP